MMSEIPEEVRRWAAKRRLALVVSTLKGETSVAEAARRHSLTVAEIEEWQERFQLGAENAPRARPKDDEALKEDGGVLEFVFAASCGLRGRELLSST